LDEETDERLYALLGADLADPIAPHLSHRRWVRPPSVYVAGGLFQRDGWTRLAPEHWTFDPVRDAELRRQEEELRPPPGAPHEIERQAKWFRSHDLFGRPLPEIPEGYASMEELMDDAALFVAAVESRYCAEIFDLLDAEYAQNNPAQQGVLRVVRERFDAMRFKLKANLELQKRPVQPPPQERLFEPQERLFEQPPAREA